MFLASVSDFDRFYSKKDRRRKGLTTGRALISTLSRHMMPEAPTQNMSTEPEQTSSLRGCFSKWLQDNANHNATARTPPPFIDMTQADKPVVQLYVCFFCEKDFADKESLQSHQKICELCPPHLKDLCTPNKPTRPRVVISDARKNMYAGSLGLLPVEKAKHVELAHRIRRDSQIDCDLIEVDKAPAIIPRTPSTPRTPKSLISFNSPSSNKQHEVYTVSSDDESDSGSSDGSLLGTQDYMCSAPLMTIDFSSPLGQRIKGHVKQVSKPNITEYEKFCRTPVKNRFKERLRDRDSFVLVTFKHKRHFRKYCHTYRFTKDDNRDFMASVRTGLSRYSRYMLKRMKPCSVVLNRLPKDHCTVYKKSKTVNVRLAPLTPEQINRWIRRSPSPDKSCTFPPTPVIKCYDLKSLLGATPSRLAVLDKNSKEIDEHTQNRVIVYNAIVADAMQDSDAESGPDKSNGQQSVMRSLLRKGNPNPLPMTSPARARLVTEGLDDDCVFSHTPGMESQQKEKKAEYVPQMLTSLSPEKTAAQNSAYQSLKQSLPNVQRVHPVLQNRLTTNFSASGMPSQTRQAAQTNNSPWNMGTSQSTASSCSAQLSTSIRPLRRSGRARVIENKIDDEISILVPVNDNTSPPTNSAQQTSTAKRPLDSSGISGLSPKRPRIDPGKQNINAVQPRQVVKRLAFDNPGVNQAKPLASVQPTRSSVNNVTNAAALNPRINLGSRQAHNINLTSSPSSAVSNSNRHIGNVDTRPRTNSFAKVVKENEFNVDNLPKLGVHENGKSMDSNFLFKCHLCGLEEQYTVNATNRIYHHLHTIHKNEVIHIVDYNTQGEVHLVEAMGQPPTMIRTSNFTKSPSHVEGTDRATTNPPAYFGVTSEPSLGLCPPKTDSISVPSVEGAWCSTLKNKLFNNNATRQSTRQSQVRGKVSPQYSLRPKSPPKSYGQPTPPTTPQSHQSMLSRRPATRFNNNSGTKPCSIVIDDDDVVCLDDDVICIS